MTERYTKQQLETARELAGDLSTKRIERIALALAEAERKGAADARAHEQERTELFWQRVAGLTGGEVQGG